MIITYKEDFKNFMSSKNIYFETQEYWKSIISDCFNQSIHEWIDTSFANGQKIEDGNPLFSCRIGEKKAIRIIQDKRNLITPIFASWNSVYNFDGEILEELVIALQPYKSTYYDAFCSFQNLGRVLLKNFNMKSISNIMKPPMSIVSKH